MSLKVLITGAARGLGFNLAEAFLKNGNTVYGIVRELQGPLKSRYPETYHELKADVRDEASLKLAAKELEKLTQGLDILVNNAAVHLEQPVKPDIGSIDFTAIENTFAVNTLGPLKMVQSFISFIRKGGKKLIVNISSEAGSIGDCWRESEYGYCMSKAALNMQSKILQNRLAKEGIHILAVHPGWVRTDMGGQQADLSPDESAGSLLKLITRDWKPEDPIYMDWTGKKMNW